MHPGIHKLRYLLATQPILILRIGLVVALIGAIGAGITFTNPPTTDEVAQSDQQPISMRLHSHAVVEEASSFYSRGETLTDMPVYMRSTTSAVTLSLVTTPPNDRRTEISQQIALVYEARTVSDEVFWQKREILGQTTEATSGDTVVSNASLNISTIDQKLSQLNSEIGDAGHVRAYVIVESQSVSEDTTRSMSGKEAIEIREESYEIPPIVEERMVGERVKTTEVDSSKSSGIPVPLFGMLFLPHTTLLFALIGLSGAVGGGASIVFADRFDAEDEQRALHKARYAEWISEGTLPTTFAAQSTHMRTLEDLVDMAIDTESRIVYDSSQGKFAVIGSEMVYQYDEDSDQEFLWT